MVKVDFSLRARLYLKKLPPGRRNEIMGLARGTSSLKTLAPSLRNYGLALRAWGSSNVISTHHQSLVFLDKAKIENLDLFGKQVGLFLTGEETTFLFYAEMPGVGEGGGVFEIKGEKVGIFSETLRQRHLHDPFLVTAMPGKVLTFDEKSKNKLTTFYYDEAENKFYYRTSYDPEAKIYVARIDEKGQFKFRGVLYIVSEQWSEGQYFRIKEKGKTLEFLSYHRKSEPIELLDEKGRLAARYIGWTKASRLGLSVARLGNIDSRVKIDGLRAITYLSRFEGKYRRKYGFYFGSAKYILSKQDLKRMRKRPGDKLSVVIEQGMVVEVEGFPFVVVRDENWRIIASASSNIRAKYVQGKITIVEGKRSFLHKSDEKRAYEAISVAKREFKLRPWRKGESFASRIYSLVLYKGEILHRKEVPYFSPEDREAIRRLIAAKEVKEWYIPIPSSYDEATVNKFVEDLGNKIKYFEAGIANFREKATLGERDKERCREILEEILYYRKNYIERKEAEGVVPRLTLLKLLAVASNIRKLLGLR